jgi:secreted Zn-dependent insulinase-like peptidase
MSYEIAVSPGGIQFEFVGFAPSMPTLTTKVLSEFNAFNKDSSLTPQVRWDRLKHQYGEDLKTFENLPIQYAISDCRAVITKGAKSRAQLLEALENDETSLKSSAASASNLLLSRQLQLTSLAMGNMGEDEARTMIGDVVKGMESPKNVVMSQSSDAQVERITPIVNIQNPVEVRKLNPRLGDENDVAVVSILAGPATVENRVTLGLINGILQTAAFSDLRTQETLGYIAEGGQSRVSNVQGLIVLVQGSTKDADEMAASIHYVFSVVMPKRLQEMTDAQFNDIKASLRHEIATPPVTDESEFKHFSTLIAQGGNGGFELMNEMLKYLDGPMATKQSLIAEWDRLVLQKEGQRKIVTVKYFANETSLNPPSLEQSKELWTKHKLPASAVALLQREFKATKHLKKVDSEEVAKLATEGGYFPTEPHLKLKDATAAAKGPIKVPQQIQKMIAKRQEEIDAFVDTPIVYRTNVTKSSFEETDNVMRAYSMTQRGTFAVLDNEWPNV